MLRWLGERPKLRKVPMSAKICLEGGVAVPLEGAGHRWMVDRCASDTREDRGPGGRAQV